MTHRMIHALAVSLFIAATFAPAHALRAQEETLEDQLRQKEEDRIGRLFEKIVPTLDEARKLVDRHDQLPKRRFLLLRPLGDAQESNEAETTQLLDEAIEMLDSSPLRDLWRELHATRKLIRRGHHKLAEYRQRRVSAPREKEAGLFDRAFISTKEDYDKMIAAEEGEIKASEKIVDDLKDGIVKLLKELHLDIDRDGLESLLSSVSGDDFVSMIALFDNIRQLTGQLQDLTEQSGEALDIAKRYYGMHVVLVKIMDRMQHRFITEIDQEHIPRLQGYTKDAEGNIRQALELIRKEGGDENILRSNIESNELTMRAAKLYTEYLLQNADLIRAENKQIKKNLSTALNTYKTVKLSSDVSRLMKTGRQNFEALMKLQIPPLREFRNEMLRKEYQRMTTELLNP
ncbi:MAG: hypothetical protein VYB15_06715 [Planctomycetota bacterium]|nr:hypothetical protein [Planctomycetota bacterium]